MDTAIQEIASLAEKVKGSSVPDKLKEEITVRLTQLGKLTASPTFLPEFDRVSRFVEWVTTLPWEARTQDNLDLTHAKQVLDKNHQGLGEIKDRVLEYISVMKLKQEKGEGKEIFRAPILCFVGLVGTGKTTIAASIAETLGRKFARIPFGGMGDPLDLRGQSRMHAEAEPGKIIKALKGSQSKNPVILLDEIDRVTDAGRASIMGVLVELLDPEQNYAFTDHYLDYPVDLSEVLFIATANNTTTISTAVLDRLEPLSMPSYSDAEKIAIGTSYVLPRLIKEAGIRTLERTIEGIVRKVARSIVEGKGQSFKITPENVKEFLPQ